MNRIIGRLQILLAVCWAGSALFYINSNPLVTGMYGFSAVVVAAGAFQLLRYSNWKKKNPTQAQLDFAGKLGIRVPKNATRGDVSAMIDAAKAAKAAKRGKGLRNR